MTVRCAWCQKTLGEKCGRCGSEDVRKEYSFAAGKDYWRCFECKALWLPGREMESHGICDPPCAEAIKAGVRCQVSGAGEKEQVPDFGCQVSGKDPDTRNPEPET